MAHREQGRSQAAAAAKAGLSERTGRRIERQGPKCSGKPRALAGLVFRDELLPDANWQAIFQRLRDELMSDEACKRVVGGVKLAADQDRSGPIGQWWLNALNEGRTLTLIELQGRFRRPVPAPVGGPCVPQHALADYDSLLKEACHG